MKKEPLIMALVVLFNLSFGTHASIPNANKQTKCISANLAKSETTKFGKTEVLAIKKRLVDPYDPVKGLTLNGNEPFWSIEIKDKAAYVKNMFPSEIIMDFREIEKVENGWELKVSEADMILFITIRDQIAFDDMSSQVYPYSVSVLMKVAGDPDVIYNGVGNKTGTNALSPHPEEKGNIYNNFKDISDSDVYKLVDQIKFAIIFNNPSRMAGCIKFPLKYNIGPGKSKTIQTKKEFIAQYKTLIHEEFKSQIFQIDYSTLGENYQGIFPDGGAIWITSVAGKPKVFVINGAK